MSSITSTIPSSHTLNTTTEVMGAILQGVQERNAVMASSAVAPAVIPAAPGISEGTFRARPSATLRNSNATLADVAAADAIASTDFKVYNAEFNISFAESDYAEQVERLGSTEAYIQSVVGDIWSSKYTAFAGRTADGCAEAGSLTFDRSAGVIRVEDLYDAEQSVIGDFAAGQDSGMGVMVVHSKVFNDLRKANAIEFVQSSELSRVMPVFAGYQVVVDDAFVAVKAEADADFLGLTGLATDTVMYASYMMRPESMKVGVQAPKVPFEVEREASVGNGGGAFTAYSRVQTGLYVEGFSWAGSATPASAAEMATASNWAQRGSNKDAGLSVVISQ